MGGVVDGDGSPNRPEDMPRVQPMTQAQVDAAIASYVPFEQRQGELMDLIRAAHADWEAGKQALIDFTYAPPWKSKYEYGAPGWWDDVEDQPTLPDTFEELEMAGAAGMLTSEQVTEVNNSLFAKHHPHAQPGDVFAPDGRFGYWDADSGAFVERT